MRYTWISSITSRACIIFSHAGVFCLCFAFCMCSCTLFAFRSPAASLTSITIICILNLNISRELDWDISPRLTLTFVRWHEDWSYEVFWSIYGMYNHCEIRPVMYWTPNRCLLDTRKPGQNRKEKIPTVDYGKSTPISCIFCLSFLCIKFFSWLSLPQTMQILNVSKISYNQLCFTLVITAGGNTNKSFKALWR